MKPAKRQRILKPEYKALLAGLGILLTVWIHYLLPAFRPPYDWTGIDLALNMLVLVFVAVLILTLLETAKEGPWWKVLVVLAVIGIGGRLASMIPVDHAVILRGHFDRTRALRELFVLEARKHEPGEFELTGPLAALSEYRWATFYRDEEGREFMSYSVSRMGLDNCIGFCFSPSGSPPPPEAFHRIVHSEPMGGGWFLFRST